MIETLFPGSIIKIQFKEGDMRYFKFTGYGRDFKRMANMGTIDLARDGRVLFAVPLGRTTKIVINGEVVPELIPIEDVVHLEVVDER